MSGTADIIIAVVNGVVEDVVSNIDGVNVYVVEFSPEDEEEKNEDAITPLNEDWPDALISVYTPEKNQAMVQQYIKNYGLDSGS